MKKNLLILLSTLSCLSCNKLGYKINPELLPAETGKGIISYETFCFKDIKGIEDLYCPTVIPFNKERDGEEINVEYQRPFLGRYSAKEVDSVYNVGDIVEYYIYNLEVNEKQYPYYKLKI